MPRACGQRMMMHLVLQIALALLVAFGLLVLVARELAMAYPLAILIL